MTAGVCGGLFDKVINFLSKDGGSAGVSSKSGGAFCPFIFAKELMLFIDDIFGDNIYNILSSKAVYRFCRKEGMYMRFTIEHLVKRFEKKEVLRDIDFTFESGKIYGLLGRNGAGKTTLFNCLNKDMKADGGDFYLEEGGQKRETVPDDIGYVLSTPTVPEFLTGREFLKFFIDIHKDKIEESKNLDAYFDYMSIAPEDRDKLLKDYSHGMKNKMQMLVNIIAKPNLLFLDEPLTSLDVVVAEEMKQILRSLKEDRIIIVSTHIMDLALDLCDEIVLLNHGVLDKVDKTDMDSHEFKEKILAVLRDERPID